MSNNKEDMPIDENTDISEKTDKTDNESENKECKLEPVAFFSLFRYSSGIDKVLIIIGIIFSIVCGAGLPAIIIFFGDLIDIFVKYEIFNQMAKVENPLWYYNASLDGITDKNQYLEIMLAKIPNLDVIFVRLNLENESFVDKINKTIFFGDKEYIDDLIQGANELGYTLLVVMAGLFVSGHIMVASLSAAANNQTYRIRINFFKSILKQDIIWFDTKTSVDLATKVTGDLDKIQNGIGDKVALCVFAFSSALFSLVTAFYYGWELTLVILSMTPIIAISFTIISKIEARFSTTEAMSYGKAGAVAEEVFGAIKTVYAFDGQSKEIERYGKNLEPSKKSGVRRTLFIGLRLGMMWFCIYCGYGLAFWYGVKLIIRSINGINHEYDASTMLIVFSTVMMGTFRIGMTAPYFEAFTQARGVAGFIFRVIERKPIIDSNSESGVKLKNFGGRVELRNVYFNYPARKDVSVLSGLSLMADPGEIVALVGASGCGKSTVIQIIQRFYDTNEGQVLIDEKDIKDLNVGWLRDNIGVVGQEPVLFNCSIAENIKLGYSECTEIDIESAANDANAYDFIMQLPDQFKTLVGERGVQLSGGQKQRIAIARALVRKPKILLLDESTSALDMQSESIVQAALKRASVGRTTFIVAHRLSTIRNANKIFVINSGKVEEIGTHDDLIRKKGLYYNLVEAQQMTDEEPESEDITETESQGKQPYIDNDFSIENGKSETPFERNENVLHKDKNESFSLTNLLGLLEPDKWLVIIGILMAFLMGLSSPAFAFIYGEILGLLAKPSPEEIEEGVLLYSILFVAMGFASGIVSFLQIYLFGVCGERLTMRLRNIVFKTMLSQEIAWFEHKDNRIGALCTRLSSDTSSVHGATGSRLSILFQSMSTLSAGIVIPLYYNWKLGLVMMSFIPLVMASTYFQITIFSHQISQDKISKEEASRIAVEAISCIRTVASLHRENLFVKNYIRAIQTQFKKSKINAHLRGITFSITMITSYFCLSIALFYGSRLIIDDELNYGDLFKSVEAVIFGTAMVGQAVALAPDYQKGRSAAIEIFKLLKRRPLICVNKTTGEKPDFCEGNIRFREIEFIYPNRPNVKILRGLSFDVSRGQTVALVGSSGCGKSTILQLIQRFYDFDAGELILDGRMIVDLNIPWLRHKLGIVSQEPVLFGYSIAENIAYGDNTRVVEMKEIVRASEKANIHNFIKDLPMGYNTPVGDRGTQLSGGQKQRIAIARALIRDPEILLLDEATSALDTESEQVVQQALDEVRQGRTCIVIAHRLSTIFNADKIVVINEGKVVEEGRHQELIARRGAYFELFNVQSVVQK